LIKVIAVFGTRPEAIKMAPVILKLKAQNSPLLSLSGSPQAEKFKIIVCVTAQHRQMLDQVLEIFDIKVDYDLNIMQNAQSLYQITTNGLLKLEEIYKREKPDLVLATSLTNSKAIQKLKNLGIEVVIFPAPKNYAYLCDQFLTLGKAVDKEAEATAIIAESKEKVMAIRAGTAGFGKPKVFIEIGAKPLFTANRDYFINDFVEMAAGVNIAQDAKLGTYSREEVLRKNPDVIIIVMMGIAVEKEKEVWQKFKDLNAVRDNRIYVIDSRKVCSPTPVTFVETLNEIAGLLHPELSRRKQ